MKQHYLGIALFCSIMVATAVGVDYFRTAAVPTVPPPLALPDNTVPYEVDGSSDAVSYDTESAVYFVERGALVMRVRLEWNGSGIPPSRVRISPKLFSRYDFKNAMTLEPFDIDQPFRVGDSKVVEIESRRALGGEDVMDNYYVAFSVSDTGSGAALSASKPGLANMFHVLVSHGDGRVRGLD